jgi:hypothetical protein
MVTKVNSGVYKDQFLTGSLRAFVIAGTDVSAMTATADAQAWTLANGTSVTYNLGDSVPDTLAEIVCRVIATRATIVSIEAGVDGALNVLVENAAGWGYGSGASLDAELEKLSTAEIKYSKSGSTVGTVASGGAAFTVTETRLVFDTTNGALGTLLDGSTAKTIGGLGGNEHDQDTVSNNI